MNALQITTYCLYLLIFNFGDNGRDTMTLPLITQGKLSRLGRPEWANLPNLSDGSDEFP
jgi:hypothetical protein